MLKVNKNSEACLRSTQKLFPSDWKITDLKEVAYINMGQSPDSNFYNDIGDGLPLIQGNADMKDRNSIQRIFTSQITKVCEKGDFILSVRAPVGSIGIASFKSCIGRGVCAIKPKNIDSEYLFQLMLHSEAKWKKIEQGSTFTAVNSKDVNDFKLLITSRKSEQIAIAHILSLMDTAINKNNQLIAKKELQKKWLMHNLLTGKKRLKGFNMEWKGVKLESVSNIRRGASPRPIQDPKWFSIKGRGWIRISDVTKSHFYLNQTTQYLSDEGANKSVKVDKGDLIMSICATIGIPVIVNIPACIHDGFVLFRDYEKNLTTFFLYYFIQYITDKLSGEGQPGTQKNLNTSIVGNINLNLPSIEEQNKIAEVLQLADKEIQLLKIISQNLREKKKWLMQVLLTGKLRINLK